jgi:hypothetical protein
MAELGEAQAILGMADLGEADAEANAEINTMVADESNAQRDPSRATGGRSIGGRAVSLLVTVLVTISVWVWLRSGAQKAMRHQQVAFPFRSHLTGAVQGNAIDVSSSFCGVVEENTRYTGYSTVVDTLQLVTSAAQCCAYCKNRPECRAWTWQLTSNDCILLGLMPGQTISSKTSDAGFVSGLPFRDTKDLQQTIFCYALMLPYTYEQRLLQMQIDMRVCIFACDEYDIISNQTITVAPGVNTSVVQSNLVCKKGGEFGTALNTEIFLTVWRKIHEDGRFKYHDWTVKADPDCVFFPERLRVAVQFHTDVYDGVYLNNCRAGLHGPFEVLSRAAVHHWVTGIQGCQDFFNQKCSGPCKWGEDMFMDQCLKRVHKIRRDHDWNLLSEDHCYSEDWKECKNGNVGFHPFKTEEAFRQCLNDADFGKLPMLPN